MLCLLPFFCFPSPFSSSLHPPFFLSLPSLSLIPIALFQCMLEMEEPLDIRDDGSPVGSELGEWVRDEVREEERERELLLTAGWRLEVGERKEMRRETGMGTHRLVCVTCISNFFFSLSLVLSLSPLPPQNTRDVLPMSKGGGRSEEWKPFVVSLFSLSLSLMIVRDDFLDVGHFSTSE